MGKSVRSNSQKALRTVRRQKVYDETPWLQEAERKRQEALAKVLAAEAPRPSEPELEMNTMEETQVPMEGVIAVGKRKDKKSKAKQLGVSGKLTKKLGKKKKSVLDPSQFHQRKKKKGRGKKY